MSGYVCPHCAEVSYPFGQKGAAGEAEAKGLLLGAIPLELAVREGSDQGAPILTREPGSPAAVAYQALAFAVLDRMDLVKATASADVDHGIVLDVDEL